jgi:hypothetical protein
MKNLTAKKPDGNWWTFGNYNPCDKWGKEKVGLKISKELKELINSVPEGEYINFNVLEKKEKKEGVVSYSRSIEETPF